MKDSLHPCSFLLRIKIGAGQIARFVTTAAWYGGLSTKTRAMSSAERVLSALNFLTGEGVNHYPDDCDGSAIEALITDYFNEGHSDDESDDESNHRNEGNNN